MLLLKPREIDDDDVDYVAVILKVFYQEVDLRMPFFRFKKLNRQQPC